jgi:hypothetical protein
MSSIRWNNVKATADVVSSILNWICPECGGRMGGQGKEFKCKGCQLGPADNPGGNVADLLELRGEDLRETDDAVCSGYFGDNSSGAGQQSLECRQFGQLKTWQGTNNSEGVCEQV